MTAWYVSMKQSVRSITVRQRYLQMVRCAVSEAKNKNIEVVRSHSSSQAALTEILEQRCEIA